MPQKGAEKLVIVQADQKGPDARRSAAARVRRTGGTPQRVARRAGYPSRDGCSRWAFFSSLTELHQGGIRVPQKESSSRTRLPVDHCPAQGVSALPVQPDPDSRDLVEHLRIRKLVGKGHAEASTPAPVVEADSDAEARPNLPSPFLLEFFASDFGDSDHRTTELYHGSGERPRPARFSRRPEARLHREQHLSFVGWRGDRARPCTTGRARRGKRTVRVVTQLSVFVRQGASRKNGTARDARIRRTLGFFELSYLRS